MMRYVYTYTLLRTHESDRDTPSLDNKLYSSFRDGFFLVETTTGATDPVRVASHLARLLHGGAGGAHGDPRLFGQGKLHDSAYMGIGRGR
jgi:hypothetical protein